MHAIKPQRPNTSVFDVKCMTTMFLWFDVQTVSSVTVVEQFTKCNFVRANALSGKFTFTDATSMNFKNKINTNNSVSDAASLEMQKSLTWSRITRINETFNFPA